MKKQTKMLKDIQARKNTQCINKANIGEALEEDKIEEKIETSVLMRPKRSQVGSTKHTPTKNDLKSPTGVGRQETATLEKQGSNGLQTTQEGINFEDSLVTGTKMGISNKTKSTKPSKGLQKKLNEVNNKKQKVNEIQKKYDKSQSRKPAAKKRMTLGYSYQESEKQMKTKLGEKGAPSKKTSDMNLDGINASKITAQKRDAYKDKKHSQVVSNKQRFESKRKLEDEQTDEKLRTQTFRFTNQFKSEEGDGNYFDNYDDDIYDEFIEEEIDTESHHSPPGRVKKMQLVKDVGPMDVPSDSNPFTKKRVSIEEPSEIVGTPVCKPPKVPPRVNMNNVFKSPANEIFKNYNKNKGVKQSKPDLPLDKRNSTPAKPLDSLFKAKPAHIEESKITEENTGILGYEVSNEEDTHMKESKNHEKSMAEVAFSKIRSDYTNDILMDRPYSPPFINDQPDDY